MKMFSLADISPREQAQKLEELLLKKQILLQKTNKHKKAVRMQKYS